MAAGRGAVLTFLYASLFSRVRNKLARTKEQSRETQPNPFGQ